MLSIAFASLLLASTWGVFIEGPRVPSGVAVDARGDVYVVDTGGSHVLKLSSAGRLLGEFGKLGTGDDGLRRPRGIAIGADGTLFVADTANHRIQRFSATGEPLGPWGTIGSGAGELILPSSVALSATGELYVTDTGNHRVVRLAVDGAHQTEWGGLRFPHGISVDGQGDVFVTDEVGVHKFSPVGEQLALWPGFGDAYGITVADDGTLYVTETDYGRITALGPGGETRATWGNEGSDVGQFKFPEAVAVAPDGSILVADRGNDRVQVLR
jgi:DNA-binding beta-propeller fold protein YncE